MASYCSSFLKSEMLHIYRQVKALRGVKTFVVTKEIQNAERFPFDNIEVIPKRRTKSGGRLLCTGASIRHWMRCWSGTGLI